MRLRSGAVLPLVLLGLLVIAAVSFAMSFRVTLDVMAARSALSFAQAQALAAAGLALAVEEQQAALTAGEEPPTTHGPWPHYAVDATVTASLAGLIVVSTPDDASAPVTVPAISLTATATSGSATASAAVTIYFTPALGVLTRR